MNMNTLYYGDNLDILREHICRHMPLAIITLAQTARVKNEGNQAELL